MTFLFISGFVAAGKIDSFTLEFLFVGKSLDTFEFRLAVGIASSTTSSRETARKNTQHIATVRRKEDDEKVIYDALDCDALDWNGFQIHTLSWVGIQMVRNEIETFYFTLDCQNFLSSFDFPRK